jgi:hypothetical protein
MQHNPSQQVPSLLHSAEAGLLQQYTERTPSANLAAVVQTLARLNDG